MPGALTLEVRFRLKRWQYHIMTGEIPHVTSEPDFLELATTWLRIFDHAFFFNLVRSGLNQQNPIKIYYDDSDERANGYCTHGCFIIKPTISLNTYRDDDDGSASSLARDMIGVLLHEMLHAFLWLYCCECDECDKRTVSGKGHSGQSGHGPNFINALNAIEEAFQDHIQWEVDGGIMQSLALEMATSGWVSRDDQLQRWGIDYQDLVASAEEMEPGDLNSGDGQVLCLCSVM
ncbi:hypothetical protein BKA64DRAFT_640929 [Cadophora sp. MPI-SDFR-AT-0126]|nr:hypothetical protein BKA64DRAFT_640929 [Leotiomycetes sp. MPI-SDFR-AT-0126]